MELCEELKKASLDILIITETKKKGKGITKLGKNHILIYSGVDENERASAGVGCITHKNNLDLINKWETITERIMIVEMKGSKQVKTIIAVYGPDENERKEKKDRFWEELTQVVEASKGKIYIVGDFNARVGRRDNLYKEVIGNEGECVRNNNGIRLLEFCQTHDLIVTNTFFQHKDIHKYTREEPSRGEKSIIDYIVTERENKKAVLDVKVNRGSEINSDHYLLAAKVRQKLKITDTCREESKRKVNVETIRTYKLREPEIAEKYQEVLDKEMGKILGNICNEDDIEVEELWEKFKNTIIKAAKTICGTAKNNNGQKQTAWWNEDIKIQVKLKKQKWQNYLNNRTTANYGRYKDQREKVKNLVRESKQKSWMKFGEKLEHNSKENQKLFYKILKNLRNKESTDIITIRNEEGKILTEEKQIMTRWKEYFKKLLNPQDTMQEELQGNDEDISKDEEQDDITKDELIQALKKLKNGKSPGEDKITAEMLKNMGEQAVQMLLKLFHKIQQQAKIPNDWTIGLILPIHKKGDRTDCNNYRGITLLSVVMKVYEQIIENRLRVVVEPTLTETQSGFRKGRSTQDHVFTLKDIIYKSLTTDKKVYMAFLDLEKAFDRTPRARIWDSLRKRNVSNKLIKAVKSIYRETNNCVISKNMKSEIFTTKEGVRQGGGLSPLLFITFMDDIIKECKLRLESMSIGYRKLQKEEITECAFADDVVLVANNEKNLQHNLNVWNEVLQKNGMKLNTEKTKVMVIAKNKTTTNIDIHGVKIKQVEAFQYLGTTIEETGKNEIEIAERVRKANNVYYAMSKGLVNKKEISRRTKMNVYKTIFRPILTYGCESWVLSQQQKSKIQANEMKYLRRVKGVTRQDRIRNDDIREELEIQSIGEFIEQRQMSWWGHLQRMKDSIPVKRIWETKMHGKRKKGRPKKSWDSTVNDILQKKRKNVDRGEETGTK